jgi:DNA-binding GntR family transcriptional regulator
MSMTKLAGIDRAATQADQAYEALLAEILDCRLAPGAKITISAPAPESRRGARSAVAAIG